MNPSPSDAWTEAQRLSSHLDELADLADQPGAVSTWAGRRYWVLAAADGWALYAPALEFEDVSFSPALISEMIREHACDPKTVTVIAPLASERR